MLQKIKKNKNQRRRLIGTCESKTQVDSELPLYQHNRDRPFHPVPPTKQKQ